MGASELLTKKRFHKSLYLCCAEAYYFIMNIQVRPFEDFINESKADLLQTWRSIGLFQIFDQTMPLALRKHFMELETELVCKGAWRDEAAISAYASSMDSGKENKQANSRTEAVSLEQQFFNRVMIYAASQIYHLCSGLPVTDEVMEFIWAVLKYILTQRLDLLKNRQLDQLIFCTIYSVTKVFKEALKFQEIINKFQELPLTNSGKLNEIVYDVLLDNGAKGDLIEFYNKVYITKLKEFLSKLPSMEPQELCMYKQPGKRKNFGER